MFWILIKLMLAMIISAIPFIIKYYIIPKGKANAKYRNSLSLALSYMPWFKAKISLCYLILINFFRKMEVSKKNRRFYRLVILVLIMMLQIINVNASQAALREACAMPIYCETFETWPWSFNFWGLGQIATLLIWNRVAPIYNLIMMVMIFSLLSNKLFDKVLSKMNQSIKVQVMFLPMILLFAFEPSGTFFMFAEMLSLLLFAAWAYLPINKEKSLKYYSILTIHKSRSNQIFKKEDK